METKHTKGEWTPIILDLADCKDVVIGLEESNKVLCRVHLYSSKITEEDLANAKLIASAPDLLEALEVCYASLCTYGRHPLIEKQVNEAIKKATK